MFDRLEMLLSGGTSIANFLKTVNQSEIVYHDIGRHVYTKHGSRHNWRSDDLLKLARREKRKIIVSAETGLDDLTQAKYPWFNETCTSNKLPSVH